MFKKGPTYTIVFGTIRNSSARVEFRTVTLKILETLIIDSALQA